MASGSSKALGDKARTYLLLFHGEGQRKASAEKGGKAAHWSDEGAKLDHPKWAPVTVGTQD